jgi:perosamine synthetase
MAPAAAEHGLTLTIPISKPYFGPEEREAILAPLESGWVVQGPYVAEFERQFAAFTGSPFAAATTSCTTALHLAVACLGLEPGDEVIVPAFTWVATANVVEHMGATPVFCDIDLRTFNIDVIQMQSVITARTVGVIPVHLFGLCAPIDAIVAAAARHGLWVVEDAACGFGATLGGRHVGTFGDMGCFSFHPRKAITTGEGGMVTTRSADADRLVRCLRDHGASRTDLARHTGHASYLLPEYDHAGYNYRMTDLQGALGCAQMKRAAWLLDERRRVACGYDQLLARFDWLERPATPDGYGHGYQSYACLFSPERPSLENVERLHARRNQLMDRLEHRGIATRQGTHAPVLTGYYARKYGLRPEQFPSAVLADRLSLSLPMYVQLTDSDLHQVCEALGDAIDA